MTEADLEHARQRDLAEDVVDADILVATGAGGVGKTTTAAALGLAAAHQGRRTLVLTIDPARRLAQSLGVDELDNTPRQVDLGDDEPTGGDGHLWAMMLDMQRTFDEVLDRHAASRRQAEAIRTNRIYQTLASTLSGTQEYMAMEKLHALHDENTWDLLIIDTPPTRNALDFLDAPKRMTDFLEGRLLKMLLKPGMAAGRSIGRVVNFSTRTFMRVASRVTGMGLLEDLAEFFRNFEGMYDGFKRRAQEVRELLARPSSRFVVVASPQPPPLREARFFVERLQQEGMHTAGVVINRVQPECPDCPVDEDLYAAAAAADGPAPADRGAAGALRLLADTNNVATRERRDVNSAFYGLRPPALIEVPLLRSDVHDLETLHQIAGALVTHDAT